MASNVPDLSATIIDKHVTYREPIVQKEYLAIRASPPASRTVFIVCVAKIETHNFSEENGGGRIEKRRGLWCFIPL